MGIYLHFYEKKMYINFNHLLFCCAEFHYLVILNSEEYDKYIDL